MLFSEERRVRFLEAVSLQVDYLDPVKDRFQDLKGKCISPDSQGMKFLEFHLKIEDFYPSTLAGCRRGLPNSIQPLKSWLSCSQIFEAHSSAVHFYTVPQSPPVCQPLTVVSLFFETVWRPKLMLSYQSKEWHLTVIF